MTEAGAPKFALTLDGYTLGDEELRHVVSIEFVEALEKLDALTIQFAVPTVDKWLVTELAEVGIPFQVELGYASSTTRKGFGDITEVSHSVSPASPWTISLTGLDGLNRLKGKPRSKVWEVSHNQIVESIASEHGLTPNVEGVSGSAEHTFQSNVDDAIFLKQLARDHNYFVRAEDDVLRFGRRSIPYEDTVTLTWGRDLEDVKVRASINDLKTVVRVKGRNYAQNQDVAAEAATGDLENISGGELGVDIADATFGEREHLIDHARRNQSSSATDKAAAQMQDISEKFISGSLTCLGRPEACSGGLVQIEGLPWPFMGPFLITQATHTLEPGVGYRTKLDFLSNSYPPEE